MKSCPTASQSKNFEIFFLLVFSLSGHVSAAESIGVAVVTDGPQFQLREVEDVFREELIALTSNEFDLRFRNLPAEWSASSVSSALEAAYRDPSVDIVLVLGFAGNQLAVSRDEFPKPTFLPLVFNPDLLDAPSTDVGSGRHNLNYLADRVPFRDDLASYQRVMPFEHAALLTDAVIIESIPRGRDLVRAQGGDVEFTFVGHDGVTNDLLSRLPAGVDAILLGGLPRLPPAMYDALLRNLAERKLPVYSLVGDADVRRGALASDALQTDYRRLARRNALNMQAVMLGESAEDQSIYYDGKRQLTINMAVARTIGLSPRFDVLSEAELINAQEATSGPALTLASVAQSALERNLDIAVSEFDVGIGQQSIVGARANLLPQFNVSANYASRQEEILARSAALPQRSASGAVSLDQALYVESALSGYGQEKLLQGGRVAGLDIVRLDSVLAATSAYLQALRAENQLKIQQEDLALTKSNLELARDRVRAGSASNADVFRWEASLANTRSAVLQALAVQQQSYNELNRILNHPIGTVPRLSMPAKDDPFTMSASDFDSLINNPRRFGWFIDFYVKQGLEQAPEIAQLQAQIDAARRDVVGRRRAFWAPDISVQAQYSDNFNASGLGSGTPVDELDDWSVTLNASWPLFDSGVRRSQLSRATLREQQLAVQKTATTQRIEQNIRASLLSAQASYANIDLSQSGADASRKNLELVSDAYRQGTVSIIDLLDAQSQSLQADLTANNAVHDFLLDIVNLQRSTGSFDFLLPPAVQNQRTDALRKYISENEARRTASGEQP